MLPLSFRHRFMRAADVAGQWLYRLSGGLIGERQLRYHMLLLDTVGRKSGKPRTHTLLYFRDGERYIVVGSNFGGPKNPGWYWNLRAQPYTRIQAGRRRLAVVASEAEGDERARLWPRAVAEYANYANYQQHTSRLIPIVILTPEVDSVH